MTKIKDVKTSIYKWTGEIVPPTQNFCTNPTDSLRESGDKMKSFRFHQWMVCEVIADDGTIGLGNAALAPEVSFAAFVWLSLQVLVAAELLTYRVHVAAAAVVRALDCGDALESDPVACLRACVAVVFAAVAIDIDAARAVALRTRRWRASTASSIFLSFTVGGRNTRA